MEFNAVLGHWDQNSYISEEEANAYFGGTGYHPEKTLWDSKTDSVKRGLLIEASRRLDAYMPFAPNSVGNSTNYYYYGTPRPQAMSLPLSTNLVVTGMADSGSISTLVASDLADAATYSKPDIQYGSIRITAGTGIYQSSWISDFSVSTGTITLSPALATAIDSTSEYTLLYPLALYKRNAVMEFAIVLARGNFDLSVNSQSLGNVWNPDRPIIPQRVIDIIRSGSRIYNKAVR